MRQRKRKTDKVAVALVLCFCVVALASIFTVKANLDKLRDAGDENINISKEAKTEKPKEAEEVEEQEAAEPIPSVDSQDNRDSEKKPAAQSFAAPLKGKIIGSYSMDVPVYSKTLDQYMTHSGVDIAGKLSAQIKAAAGGTVTEVYNDDKYGTTIEIDHGNGFITVYSNLSTDDMVEIGDVVKQGQIISGIGESALFESLDETHLHFEMLKSGKYVNPCEYVTFE